MIRSGITLLLVSAALLVAPVVVRPAVESPANVQAANLGPGVIVGKVVNTSNRALKRRVQVRAGAHEWTLHVPNGVPVTHGRQELSVHDLDVGTYVKAIGKQIGDTRLQADKVFVIGDRLALRKAGFPERGYFARYAGYRTRAAR